MESKVKQLRLERAWSQEQLAQLSSLSTRTIQRIENNEVPSLETLSALASVFNVSVSELTSEPLPESLELDNRIAEAKKRVKNEANLYFRCCGVEEPTRLTSQKAVFLHFTSWFA